MKRRYDGFLGEPGFTGARRKRVKGDLSKIPDSAESRFRGLVAANNGDLSGGKPKKLQFRIRNHIGLDILLLIVLVILWIWGFFLTK